MLSIITPTIRGKQSLEPIKKSLEKQTYQDFEWIIEYGTTEKNDLNAAYNRLIRKSVGDVIVSIQDHTSFEPNFLQKIVDDSEEGVFYTVDVGHTDSKEVEWDWRHNRKGEPVKFNEFEICVGVMPKDRLIEVGGFDEELDTMTWGFDNVNLGLRIEMAGYPMKVHPTAEAVQYKHDLTEPHPFRHKMIPEMHNSRLDKIRNGSVIVNMVY